MGKLPAEIMNTGWHRDNAFTVPQLNDVVPMWHQSIVYPFRTLFNFDWLTSGMILRFEQNPLVHRETGMPRLGGAYEHCILAFDPADASSMPERLISFAAANAPAPVEPEGMNVTVRSGAYSDESKHWVKLYDPYSFERVRLSPAEFSAFAQKVSADANSLLKSVDQSKESWHKNRTRDDAHDELVSSSLLLASLFSQSRLDFATILNVRLAMPYAATYACLSDLPSDGTANQIPVSKLLRLYA